MISKLHQEVAEFLKEHEYRYEGWPGSEANLGQMLGLKGVNLRLDFLVYTKDDRCFGIEVQSTLHDERGEGAWGRSREEHLHRMACDETKKHLLADLGLPCVYVWGSSDIGYAVEEGVADAVVLEVDHREFAKKTEKRAFERFCTATKDALNQRPPTFADVKRVFETDEERRDGFKPQKMNSNSSFGPGQKMTGGSSFKKKK